MNIDDQKLDELLRDVPVPPNLKSRLREIPTSGSLVDDRDERPTIKTPVQKIFNKQRLVLVAAIAASLLAIVAGSIWFELIVNSNHTLTNAETGGDDPQSVNNEDSSLSSSSQEESLDVFEMRMAMLEQQLHELKMQTLRAELQGLRNQPGRKRDNRYVDPMAIESVIESVAGQMPMYVAGDLKEARSNMVSVISRYPDTRGAQLAQMFLAEN